MSISGELHIQTPTQAQVTSDGKAELPAVGTASLTTVTKTYRKVAILGSAESSLSQAPINDDSWERWGLAWSHDADTFRCTRYFDPHQLEWMTGRHKDYVEHLNKLPAPVYMLKQYEQIKNCMKIPLEDILACFVGYRNLPNGSYASSIAYMVAMAIYEGVDEIGMWGVDLLTEGEYAIQRPNVEYLLGVAEGKGIKLTIPETSALLKGNHSYGFDLVPNHETGITWQYLRERRGKYDDQRKSAMAEGQTYNGACQELSKLMDLEELAPFLDKLRERHSEYDQKRREAMARAQTFDGAWQEADALMTQVKHWERGGVVAGNQTAVRALPKPEE